MSYDIEHGLKVASHFKFGSEEWIVATLHDVLEDTELTAGDLRKLGVPEPIIQDIVILTRVDESYKTYIGRVYFGGKTVKAVKLADLRENLRRAPGTPYASLVKRYEEAIEYLES